MTSLDLGSIYCKLLIIATCGILLIVLARKFARRTDANELTFSRKQRIWGTILIILGVLFLILFLGWIIDPVLRTDLLKSTSSVFGDDGIVRNTDTPLIWGYYTYTQSTFFRSIYSAFLYIALGVYVKNFQRNKLPKWRKVSKLLGYICMVGVFCNCSEFHYFDFWEFFPKLTFLVLALFLIRISSIKKVRTQSLNDYPSNQIEKEGKDTIIKTEVKL